MFTMTLKKSITLGLTGLVLATSLSAMAAKKGHINIASKVEKIEVFLNEKGQKEEMLVPATKILPGETIYYTNTFKNISNKAAANVGLTNPIPKHTVYINNSAQGANCDITFSVDGGKHWGKPTQLKIRNKQGKLIPAQAKDYTHIHWQYRGSLKPKQTSNVSFESKLL